MKHKLVKHPIRGKSPTFVVISGKVIFYTAEEQIKFRGQLDKRFVPMRLPVEVKKRTPLARTIP
jgi:hypothetical protein